MFTMPSKLKKAIGAVKDQTSLSLAKFSNANCANLEITVLKATSHDVVPIDHKYIQEILTLISSNKAYAAAAAQAIAKRIGKTRNWIVVVKSLMLVLRIFQDGDPYFPIEVLHAMKRGAKILNLSNFGDDSIDYTAFVRTFALYLDDRLDCFVSGRLQRRFTYQRDQEFSSNRRSRRSGEPPTVVRDMKPAVLLDRIRAWQKLLDRAIAAAPTGAAQSNRLVLMSIYAIVQETYVLYRDISDGLALLLDSFFHLQHQSCVQAFQACVKASKQFDELSSFYGLCKNLGVGRTSEYPSVHKISEELLETLQEFLKDQASFPGRSPPTHLQTGPDRKDKGLRLGLEQKELANSEQMEASDKGSAFGSACTSLEDLTSIGGEQNGMISPSWSAGPEFYNTEEQPDIPEEDEFVRRVNGHGSSQSLPTMSSCLDLVSFDDWPSQSDEMNPRENGLKEMTRIGDQNSTSCGWELELVQSSPSPSTDNMDSLYQQSSVPQQLYINPFLQDEIEIETLTTSANETSTSTEGNGFANFGQDDFFLFSSSTMQELGPSFYARNKANDCTVPTFSSQNSNKSTVVMTFPTQNADHASMPTTATTALAVVPTFGAQSPKGSISSPKLLSHFTGESSVTPTSTTTVAAPTFCEQSSKESITPPTLWSQFTDESPISPTTALAPPFCAWSSNETATTPAFAADTPREMAMKSPTFCARTTNDTSSMALTVGAQSQSTTETPTFCATDTNCSTMTAPNAHSRQLSTTETPTFRAIDTNSSAVSPTFHAENCNATTLSTFNIQNPKVSGMGPRFRAENSNATTTMAPTFQADEPNDFGAAPTFSARRGSFSSIENDPFASFSNGTTSTPMRNGFSQESLMNQQRLWLEQQNKIITKHMASECN